MEQIGLTRPFKTSYIHRTFEETHAVTPARRLESTAVQHLKRMPGGVPIPPNAHVIIPAKNVARGLPRTLAYLAKLGFPAQRVHVIVNGSTDDTLGAARRDGRGTVHIQDEVLTGSTAVMAMVEDRFHVNPSRLHGKGVAMFAGTIVLAQLDLPDDTPVVFLDGDISNIDSVDPVGHLFAGWSHWSADRPDIIKLASQGRQNEGIIAMLNTTTFSGIACLEWPLCGQVIVPWGVLKKMRLTTTYSVEMAMLMHIWARPQSERPFAEVGLSAPLRDDPNPDGVHVRMYTRIIALIRALELTNFGRSPLSAEEIRTINLGKALSCFVPAPHGEGPPRHEELLPDAVLPCIDELLAFASELERATRK